MNRDRVPTYSVEMSAKVPDLGNTSTPNLVTIGLDLGGTWLKGGLVGRAGRVFARRQIPSGLHTEPDRVLARLQKMADTLLEQALDQQVRVAAIGLSSTIDADPIAGRFKFANYDYLKKWEGYPVVQRLQEKYDLPVRLENDAVAAAWGEYEAGAARGYNSVVYVALGTGIGGGVILAGQRLYDSVGTGAGFGHMSIDFDGPACACGQQGCWELFASGTALGQRAVAAVAQKGQQTEVGPRPDGAEITAAAGLGDALAQHLLAETGFYLGVGLVNLANLFNPAVIVLGGGLIQAGDYLLEPARAYLDEKRLPLRPILEVKRAELEPNSGVIGAALLAWEQVEPAPAELN